MQQRDNLSGERKLQQQGCLDLLPHQLALLLVLEHPAVLLWHLHLAVLHVLYQEAPGNLLLEKTAMYVAAKGGHVAVVQLF
jgi:hypothetical protein